MDPDQQKAENLEKEVPHSSDLHELLNEKMALSDLEAILTSLEKSFQTVSSLEDPLKQEYEIVKEAKNLDIPLDSYRRMFETYQANRVSNKVEIPLIRPFKLFDQRLGDVVKWCENLSIYGLATVIGQLTLLVAMGAYFLEGPQRRQESINNAREEIREQKDVKYSQSRIQSLEPLNKLCESLLGGKIEKANLEEIKLNQCYQFKLDRKTFFQWPPQIFHYKGFNLSWSNLAGVNLKGANLEGINLEGANLQGANLQGANLKGANLRGANLKASNLRMANLENADLEGANLNHSFMSRIQLKGANLSKTSMIQGVLLWSNLEGAKLIEANLQNANLSRANLQGTVFYKANLKGALMRYADLRNGSIMIGAQLEGANLKRAKLWSIDQLKRAYDWELATKDEDWEARITNPQLDTYKIGYLIPNDAAIYKLYQQGIEQAIQEHKNVEIIPLKVPDNLQAEAQGIRHLLAEDVDVILLRPNDPQLSSIPLFMAYMSGVVPITISDCLHPKGHNVVFACYESDYYQTGYALGQSMGNWAKKEHTGKVLNVGFVDGADSTRLFPYMQGLLAGVKDTGISWKYTASTNARTKDQAGIEKVKGMLRKNPELNVLWASTEATTSISIQAVKELGLSQKVKVFGIVSLTRSWANQLLNPQEPLQVIADRSPKIVGYSAAQQAIQLLEDKVSKDYQHKSFPHRLFSQSDRKSVQELLSSTLDLEKNDLKLAHQIQDFAPQIVSQVPSILDSTKALVLPAITEQKILDKLQTQLTRKLLLPWQKMVQAEDSAIGLTLKKPLSYRVLIHETGLLFSYEPLDQKSRNLIDFTPLPHLLPKTMISNSDDSISQPVAEFKVVLSAQGKVEVTPETIFLLEP